MGKVKFLILPREMLLQTKCGPHWGNICFIGNGWNFENWHLMTLTSSFDPPPLYPSANLFAFETRVLLHLNPGPSASEYRARLHLITGPSVYSKPGQPGSFCIWIRIPGPSVQPIIWPYRYKLCRVRGAWKAIRSIPVIRSPVYPLLNIAMILIFNHLV